MSGTTPPPQLRIALFGQAGAGKTALLSSYYGTLQRSDPDDDRRYSLLAKRRAQGNQLLQKYYQMEGGHFPQSTAKHEDYVFDLIVDGSDETAVQVHIFDYPGGWWTQEESDTEAEADRQRVLNDLQQAQVGLLLVDGQKYLDDGAPYLRSLFDQFRAEILQLRRSSQPGDEGSGDEESGVPQSWIVALSKADLFADEYTGESFEREVVRDASAQLDSLAKSVGSDDLGSRFLLLSAAEGEGGTVQNAHATLGLPLVAPLAFQATLQETARRIAERDGTAGEGVERVIRIARNLVGFLDRMDDWLPKRLQLVTQLLQAVEADTFLEEKIETVRKRREAALSKGKLQEAAVLAMAEQLRAPRSRRVFHENQRASVG